MKVRVHRREQAGEEFRLRTLGESFCVAFSLYSAIPMPRVNWTKENMKYAFCFFPLVGGAVGLAVWVWLQIALLFRQPMIFAAGATALPILLTGGIHMDGFCDAMDAMGSHGDAAKRLEIMKDSRAGAFAVMGCCLCLLMEFALWNVFYSYPTAAVCFLYVLSRSLSGYGVMRFQCAKGSGLAATFANAAEKRPVAVIMAVFALGSILLMGAVSIPAALYCTIAAFGILILYRHEAYRLFGGITGDLAGWFLVVCELTGLAALVLVQLAICA